MTKHVENKRVGTPGDAAIRETPGVCGGYPCIGYTRVPVRLVVESYRATGSLEKVVQLYDMLSREQIQAALAYYKAHPDRVDEDIERNRRASEELTARPWPA